MEAENRVMLGEVDSPGSPLPAHLVVLLLQPPLGEKPEQHLVLSTWSYVGAFFLFQFSDYVEQRSQYESASPAVGSVVRLFV